MESKTGTLIPFMGIKREEQIAREFIRNRFGQEPSYEPLGKGTTPDFSVGRTAFEVRRLNQRFIREDGSNEGLEELDFRLNLAIYKTLQTIPFTDDAGTFYWGLKFRRPNVNTPAQIAKRLVRLAYAHYREGSRKEISFTEDNVTLDLIPRAASSKAFVSGYGGDDDSGGFLGEIYPTSIRLAVQDKIRQTKEIASKFDRWALVLIDAILCMPSPNDIGPLDFNLEHFDALVVLNPDGTLALEYPEGSLHKLQSETQTDAT